MAIQNRRGDYNDYKPARMLAGELAVTLQNDPKAVDGKALHVAFAPGTEKTLMTFEDAEGMIEDAAEEATAEAIEGATSRAETAAETASTNGLKAEGYAVGKQNGTDVGSGSEYYHNNAKYYKEQASSSATTASTSASSASTNGLKSEGYAVGKQNGTDVSSGSEYYHNNAKYYKEQAEAAAAQLDAEKILGNFAHYESTATASRAYAVGEHLTYNGYLYRVTAAISSGGTITVGTNVVQTTVGDEIQGGKIWIQAKSINNTSGSSGTLCTITDPLITSDHVLTKFVAANRTVITSDVSCTPSPGQAVLTGVSTATTTAEIMLERPDKVL